MDSPRGGVGGGEEVADGGGAGINGQVVGGSVVGGPAVGGSVAGGIVTGGPVATLRAQKTHSWWMLQHLELEK